MRAQTAKARLLRLGITLGYIVRIPYVVRSGYTYGTSVLNAKLCRSQAFRASVRLLLPYISS
jgi:hypothetical protein